MPYRNPATLVVFGATGDLFSLKVVPSLYRLHLEGRLPKDFEVIGFGRQTLSDEQFQKRISDVLHARGVKVRSTQARAFINLFAYHIGTFDDAQAYKQLKEELIEHKGRRAHGEVVIYLAIPPSLFKLVLKNLKAHVLDRQKIGDVRLLIEKPLGRDRTTSQKLQALLRSAFKESEIYRIDHYLAKRVLSALPALRKSNKTLHTLLTPKYVAGVQVRLLESVGVEKRGAFFESVGALRDVGQNHLPLMLALTLMNPTGARSRFLKHLPRLSAPHIKKDTIRAQYEGYRTIDGVDPKSSVETYFKISSRIASGSFKGVPFILESGKRLGSPEKLVEVQLKGGGKVLIELEPHMQVRVAESGNKKPRVLLKFKEERGHTQYTSEYAELFYDALLGDQTRFLSHAEVELLWRFIDPIASAWKRNAVPLLYYTPDTKELKP